MTLDQARRLNAMLAGDDDAARLANLNAPNKALDSTDPLVGWDRYYTTYGQEVESADRAALAAMATALDAVDASAAYGVRRLDESMSRNTVAVARQALRDELTARATAMAAMFPAVSAFIGRLLALGVTVTPSDAATVLGRDATADDLIEMRTLLRVATLVDVEKRHWYDLAQTVEGWLLRDELTNADGTPLPLATATAEQVREAARRMVME